MRWPLGRSSRSRSADLWGTTLTQADVTNSGFGVAIAVTNTDTDGTFAKVDATPVGEADRDADVERSRTED